MSSKQNNGKQDSCSDRSETKRKRQYSIQSHESEVSCMSQETATTGLSFETDSDISETKMSSGRSVSFCVANENDGISDDPCNESESRDGQLNNSSHRVHICETMGYTSEEARQERMTGHIIYHPVNNSRRSSENSCNEENCRQPLLRRQSTFSRGTINEHPNDSELGSDYGHVQRTIITDSVQPCVCTFHHSQCQKLCSSVKLLKRVVFVLCVFNLILLIALIVVPIFTLIYIHGSKESNPGTGQFPGSSEQHRSEPSCVKCESLKKKFPNFIKTQNAIESIGDEDGKCCFSDPGKLMTILNQISEEALERAKGSISSSGPWINNGSEPTPAVHLKSRRNGLINVSTDFFSKGIESTHFVGWQSTTQREVQGHWGEVNADGASIKIRSSGMYFVYTMIRHKNNLKSIHPIPLKIVLYICQHGREGISSISQMYYSTDNRVQQNAYFGRIVQFKENDNVYLGISEYGFIDQESESHYMGLYKI